MRHNRQVYSHLSEKWELFFLKQAKEWSLASKDPSTKVGAVIVDHQRKIKGTGYNGFPRKIADNERLNNREDKYKIIVHAEINAILNATEDLNDMSLFSYPFQPCSRCASLIIQSGITEVVTLSSDVERWQDDFVFSRELFDEAGVNIITYDEEDLEAYIRQEE